MAAVLVFAWKVRVQVRHTGRCAYLRRRMCILCSCGSPGHKISLQCVYFEISCTAVPLLYHRVLPQLRRFCYRGTTFLVISNLRVARYQPSCQLFTTRISFCIRQGFAAVLETDDNRWVTCSPHIVTVHIGCELLNYGPGSVFPDRPSFSGR